MIESIMPILVAAIVVAGALFTLLAAAGLARFPDVYTRMHAASKAGTVGSGLMLVAVGVHSGDLAILVRALAGFVFFILTAPIAAHLIAKAAHQVGYRLDPSAVRDDLKRK